MFSLIYRWHKVRICIKCHNVVFTMCHLSLSSLGLILVVERDGYNLFLISWFKTLFTDSIREYFFIFYFDQLFQEITIHRGKREIFHKAIQTGEIRHCILIYTVCIQCILFNVTADKTKKQINLCLHSNIYQPIKAVYARHLLVFNNRMNMLK